MTGNIHIRLHQAFFFRMEGKNTFVMSGSKNTHHMLLHLNICYPHIPGAVGKEHLKTYHKRENMLRCHYCNKEVDLDHVKLV